jgi:hypothetical protein
MKRIPYFAGLALAVVLATVTVFVWPTQAINDPCYDSCGDAAQHISDMSNQCYVQAANSSPVSPGVTFNSTCTDPFDGHPGGYSYSCSWHWFRGLPCSSDCAGGGGFGGGNTINPNDAACLP